MIRVGHLRSVGVLFASLALVTFANQPSAQSAPSSKPEHPFKLATFEAGGKVRVGMVFGARVLDIEGANAFLTKQANLPALAMPGEMRALIEQYDTVQAAAVSDRQLLRDRAAGESALRLRVRQSGGESADQVPVEHAGGGGELQGARRRHGTAKPRQRRRKRQRRPRRPPRLRRLRCHRGVTRIVPSRDAPIMFAKSPRSCIIDPDEPFYIVDGRQRTDYEG